MGIFGNSETINPLETRLKEIKLKMSAYENSVKYDFIRNVSKTKYKSNLERILQIKKTLANLRRERTNLKTRMSIVDLNFSDFRKNESWDYKELLEFFPDANIAHIDEINNFHKGLAKILELERREYHEELTILLEINRQKIN